MGPAALIGRPSIELSTITGLVVGGGIGAGAWQLADETGETTKGLALLAAGAAVVATAFPVANAVARRGLQPQVRHVVDGAEQITRQVRFRDWSDPVRNGWAGVSGMGLGAMMVAPAAAG